MEKPLTKEEIRSYKQRLLEGRARRAGKLGWIGRDAPRPSGGARLQNLGESIRATELEFGVLGDEVNEALERIAAGLFGRCEDCDCVIGRERLDRAPCARFCTACAAAHASHP